MSAFLEKQLIYEFDKKILIRIIHFENGNTVTKI